MVLNRGVSGERAADMLARFDDSVANAQPNPHNGRGCGHPGPRHGASHGHHARERTKVTARFGVDPGTEQRISRCHYDLPGLIGLLLHPRTGRSHLS